MADDTLSPDTTSTAQTTSAPPAPQTTTPDVSATVDGGNQPAQSGPTVLVPEKRGGLGGIVDELRNALVPAPSQVYRDPNTGERYIQHPAQSGKQQWARLASEAITGAVHGLAAGRGAGNGGKAAAAGFDAQQQQDQQAAQAQSQAADEDFNIERQQRIDKANSYLQQVQLASQEFALKRMQVQAQETDVNFANTQEDREKQLGSVDLGTYGDHVTLADVKKVHPEFWKDAVNGDVRTVPVFGPDGSRKGVHLYLRQPQIGDQPADPGTKAMRFVPGKTPADPPTMEEFTPTGVHTQRDIDTYNSAAYDQMQKWQTAQTEANLKRAQTEEAKASAAVKPSEIAKNRAETTKANAEAEKATKEAEASGNTDTLADLIGTGQVAVGRMAYLLARKPELVEKVVSKYPDFDPTKVQNYADTSKDFTSGKTSVQLNAGGTALQHLKELRELNTVASHVPGTPAYTAYMNKAGTVSAELGRFYGTDTVPGIAEIKKTLTTTLPGNRDAAIRTQAKSMGDKLDAYQTTWDNSAPSKAYHVPMPGISEEAKIARADLDPEYAKRFAPPQNPAQAPQQQRAPQLPAPGTHVFSQSKWLAANPNGNLQAAIAAAKAQNFQVVQ